MSLSSIHIEGDEQLSFNKAYSILNKYFVDSVEGNQRIDYTFQIKKSNNDLDLDNAIRLFHSYAMLYKTPGEYVCEVEHLDFGFDKYIFYVPKDSKLYKLICNYENEFNKDKLQAKNSISFSERFNNYLKANEQVGIVNDVQIKPLINQKVMDTQDYGFTQGFTTTTSYIMTGFKPLKDYAKFKTGDKVKITKDFLAFISSENVNLKGFEGVVFSSLNLLSGMYNQNILNCSYDVDINGFIVAGLQESYLELISLPAIEYRKDLYDIADDIDGCLLPDYQPKSELIQKKIS